MALLSIEGGTNWLETSLPERANAALGWAAERGWGEVGGQLKGKESLLAGPQRAQPKCPPKSLWLTL